MALLIAALFTWGCVDLPFLPFSHPCDPQYEGDLQCGWGDGAPDGEDEDDFPPDAGDLDPDDDEDFPCLNGADGEVLPQWCLIDGQCYRPGETDTDQSCRHCEPEASTGSWSDLDDGQPCTVVAPSPDNDNTSSAQGICEAGICVAVPDDVCLCSGLTLCCDGCMPSNEGGVCLDDGKECTEHRCDEGGECQMQVSPGWCLDEESQRCIDPLSDANHCGACGHVCPPDHLCVEGACLPDCSELEGTSLCGDSCVILLSDQEHCGECHNACPDQMACVDGECILICAAVELWCGHTYGCVDPRVDAEHCGACSTPCPTGALCVDAQCSAPVTGVHIEPESLSLGIGESAMLDAVIAPPNATDQEVGWRSANPLIATVDGDGLATGVATGSTTITVTTAHGGHTDTINVNVRLKVAGVSLDREEVFMNLGESVTLLATVQPPDALDQSVTWASSNPSVATVNQNGRVVAQNAGDTTVTVTTSDGGHSAQCQVSVLRVPVTGVTLSPGEAHLYKGEQIQLHATVSPANATLRTLLWSSSNNAVASVNSNGLVTAEGGGEATITATTVDGGFSARSDISAEVPVSGVELLPVVARIEMGSSLQLSGRVLPEDACNQLIFWHSSDDSVASVSGSGYVDALEEGDAQITVTTDDGAYTANSAIRVRISVTEVSVSPTHLSMGKGDIAPLEVLVLPDDASDKRVAWQSSNSSVATVNQTGRVTAVGGGEATISATTVDGGLSALVSVDVLVPVTGVWIDQAELTLVVHSSSTLHAQLEPSDTTDRELVWSSDDQGVATVTQEGVVTGHNGGQTVVRVLTTVGGHEASSIVTVIVPVTGVDVSPGSVSIDIGYSHNLSATVSPTDATDPSVHWNSDDPGIARVNQAGRVTAVAEGTTLVRVTTNDGSHSANAEIQSVFVPVTGITVSPTSLAIEVGTSRTITATISPHNATNKSVTWSSSNTSIASVSTNGSVYARSTGEVSITARSVDGGRTASAGVRCYVDDSGGGWCSTVSLGIQGGVATSPGKSVPGVVVFLLLWTLARVQRTRPRPVVNPAGRGSAETN